MKLFTKEIIEKALIDTGGFCYETARMLGCSVGTIYNYLNNYYPDLWHIVKERRARMLDLAEKNLVEALKSGEKWATCFALKHAGARRGYAPKTVSEEKKTEIKKTQVVLDVNWYKNEESSKKALAEEEQKLIDVNFDDPDPTLTSADELEEVDDDE